MKFNFSNSPVVLRICALWNLVAVQVPTRQAGKRGFMYKAFPQAAVLNRSENYLSFCRHKSGRGDEQPRSTFITPCLWLAGARRKTMVSVEMRITSESFTWESSNKGCCNSGGFRNITASGTQRSGVHLKQRRKYCRSNATKYNRLFV